MPQENARVLQFPAAEAEEAVATLLRFIGEEPERDGLRDTPARVVKAWREMTGGYAEDPAEILARTFDESSDELVILRGISFYSTCEHHLLPFYGQAVVGYLPGKVVGISKLARLVECFAKRLQVQERMTHEIAHSLFDAIQPQGVAVVVEAQHLCMMARGVQKQASRMVTSAVLGDFRDDRRTRSEFMQLLCRNAE